MRERARRLLIAAGLVTVSSAAFAGPGQDGTPEARPATSVAPAAEVAGRIDALMQTAWTAAKVQPRPPASDAEFLRRLSLDVTGVVPDEEVVRAFLASNAPDRRARAIRELLSSDGYARSMAFRW